jgi:hypothetical protein
VTGWRPSDDELVGHLPVLEAALRSQEWRGAWYRRPEVRLAGGLVDGRAWLVSDLLVVPGSASVTTRLPVLITATFHYEASLLCSVMNAMGGWVVSVDTDGVPVVFSKCYLGADDEVAAARVVDLVRDNRRQAETLTQIFGLIARGETTMSEIAPSLEQPIPFAKPYLVVPVFDLSLAPEPFPGTLIAIKSMDHSVITEAEMTALVRAQMLSEQRPNAIPCAGPLVSHADGILECYGCTTPQLRSHVDGSTASCRQHRRLGNGHLCSRCNA